MKTMHIHIGVDDIEHSVKFYSAVFGKTPNKLKQDYAKWMLDDPKVNFAISTRANTKGVDHLGIQVEDDAELAEMRDRLKQADIALFNEGETVCCYANSEKSWLTDPANIAWETYLTMDDAKTFFAKQQASEESSGCCIAEDQQNSNCC